jgi:isopenicillin-N epimerase
MSNLRHEFLLEPDIIYLNHGSFGATPRPVFQAYQAWQLRMERQPVRFITEELFPALKQAREVLGAYLGSPGDDLVYIPNATFGANLVARSLALQPGDEILTTDHEYGACNNVWQYVAEKTGANYIHQPIALPATTAEEIVEQLWAGVNERTRVIYLSHITSPTALIMPVEAICRRAREAGILTVIDGAHAPGQIDLNLEAMAPDFYFGNCHKWLMSPKGAGFLYVRPERQALIEPLVVGWGWGRQREFSFGSDFLDYTQYLGTNDLSAYLAAPAAVEFQETHDWPAQRARCHALARQVVERVADLTGLPPIYPDAPPGEQGFYAQMACAPLPIQENLKAFKARLYDRHRVEVPFVQWRDRQFVRVSIQAYNSEEDVDALLAALAEELR